MFGRNEAYGILTKYLNNQNLIKHCLACEVTMRALYKKLTPLNQQNLHNEEAWGITGLLHDADYELTKNQPDMHGLTLFHKEPDVIPDDIAYAIQAHNSMTKVEPTSPMDWAIRCCDQLTGLIVAATLVLPDKKIKSLTVASVEKRMKEKSFAKGADRKAILDASEKLGIPLPEFIQITLSAMQGISDTLGL